jgi:D-alanine-D-alanine ligase
MEAEKARELQALATRALDSIGGSGMARVDFFVEKSGGRVWLNEINTLPGFTSVSMYPRLWGLSGVALPQLCDRLVKLGVERHEQRKKLDAGVREFVASVK